MRNEKSPKRDLLSKNTDGMTKRSDEEDGASTLREKGWYSQGAEKRETRERAFVENARNDPRAEIRRRVGSKDGGKKRGRIEGQKGFPKAPYGTL